MFPGLVAVLWVCWLATEKETFIRGMTLFSIAAMVVWNQQRQLGTLYYCRGCFIRLRRDQWLRALSWVGFLVAPAACALLGFGGSDWLVVGGTMTAFVAGITAVVVTHHRTATAPIFVRHKDGFVTLKVSPKCADVLSRETNAVVSINGLRHG
jgi:hypothetical protein